MGDMGELFNAMREHRKIKGEANLEKALQNNDDGGWIKHTEYHWSRMVNNVKLNYWPSRNKWQYLGHVMTGNVMDFIKKREHKKQNKQQNKG